MDIAAIIEIAAAILISLGGAGAIILALATYLGKLWAERLMERERAAHQARLKELEATLQRENERLGHNYKEKVALYKDASGPIIDLVVEAFSRQHVTPEEMKAFEKRRLATSALLAMFAPVSVFTSYNQMIDFLYDSLEGKRELTFPEFRRLALALLSEVRKDIGISSEPLKYEGTR